MIIALDAMGGDNAPKINVDGALESLKESKDVQIILVGDKAVLDKQLKTKTNEALFDAGRLSVVHASQVVEMGEATAVALRKKKDSSIRVAVGLVKTGAADAVVSAGHSGVAMATSLTMLKKAPGVDRPAIATLMPTLNGRFLLIDAGANVDCKPVNLIQFAFMGNAYYKTIFGIPNPKVALISIGEEDSKGNELTKEAFKILKETNLNFVGNIEGKDVFSGQANVVVCDGFIGNTVLKISEGLAETIFKMLRNEITKSLSAKLGYLLMKPAFSNFKKNTDYDEYGGAPLLGINGTCIICHGRSSSKAIRNAIKVANQLAAIDISKLISADIVKSGMGIVKGSPVSNAVTAENEAPGETLQENNVAES